MAFPVLTYVGATRVETTIETQGLEEVYPTFAVHALARWRLRALFRCCKGAASQV
jgi:hypothetical protein